MTNTKKPKLVIALLLCLACILTFAACKTDEEGGGTDGGSGSNGTGDGGTGTDGTDAKDPDAADLPENVSMNGKVFNLLASGWGGTVGKHPTVAPDPDGDYVRGADPMEDAGYDRKLKIEDMYDCTLNLIDILVAAEAIDAYKTSIFADDGAYDIGILTTNNFSSMLMDNYMIDLKELPYMNPNKPYWSKTFYDAMSIMGKNFAIEGDYSARRMFCVWIVAFNKGMITDYEFESPYDLVKDGRWTFDKMTEMGKQVGQDLDGSGKMTKDDVYGINYTGDSIMGVIHGAGIFFAIKDVDGIPQLNFGDETLLTKLDRIFTDLRDETYSVDTLFHNSWFLPDYEIFTDDRCLFMAVSTNTVPALRATDTDFGIIPMPKWDEAQKEYLPGTAASYHPVLTVPQTNTDLENTSIMLETLAYEGMVNVKPLFYDSMLKTKTARDEESQDMIDYIFGNLSYDIGKMYNFGGVLGVFGYDMSVKPTLNAVSTIVANEGKWQTAIDDIIKAQQDIYG